MFKNRKEKKEKPRWLKITRTVLLVYLLYLLVGALVPFMQTKEVSEEHMSAVTDALQVSSKPGTERAAILETNADALLYRLAAIQDAEERIIISTFNIRSGKSWSDISSALYDAAERGVNVQILVDGALGMVHMGSGAEFYALGSHDNIEIKYYNPINILKPWTFNGRLHDKYIIADDKYLIVGGRNFFDYFLGEYSTKSIGHDRDVFIYNEAHGTSGTGSVIYDIADYFEELWSSSICKTKFSKTPFYKNTEEALELLRENAWTVNFEVPDEAAIYESTTATDHVSFLANPTHIYSKEPYVWEGLLELMGEADDYVLIQTPYAVMSKNMYAGLEELCDTVPQVDIVINSIASGDNVPASSDYIRNWKKVLACGADVYEFQGPHSIHAKSVIIDNNISVIGSFNMDMRSTYIDTEMMIIIHGEEFTSELSGYINEQKNDALLLGEDGTYVESDTVEANEIDSKKNLAIRAMSLVSGLFRYLL